ncbi:magnesium-translocating P-type ATPase [Gordonia sp. w5E2]|uniref:magnesium-translocating P-type ATPase n=1 Tax=Gordonia TaxID=2053 RepID=UPI0009F9299C|nr:MULTISPECIES: magnesium-translocating P-type ATPase [Gordonia]
MSGLSTDSPRSGASSDIVAHAWAATTSDVTSALETGPGGLTSAEAAARLMRDGPNALHTVHVRPLHILVNQFRSALMVLLIATAILAFALGDRNDAVVIGIILAASVLGGFVNEYRAAKATEALHDRVHHSTTVIRDGTAQTIDVTGLVVGDVVRLVLGQLVPADIRLTEVTDLDCNEGVLTGESTAAAKQIDPLPADTPLADRTNCAYMGTVVQSGTATGIVVATGAHAEFGAVAAGLGGDPPQTAFQKGLSRFSVLLLQVAIVLTVFIIAANLILGRPLVESLLFALAIAVGITPQLLPAVVTTALAAGSRRLAAAKVLVKRLVAIEDLGDIDILLTDKTGTLTEGQISLIGALAPDGRPDDDVLLTGLLATDAADTQSSSGNELDTALWRGAGPVADRVTAYHRIATRPFDHVRQMASAISAGPDGRHTLAVKGAPERILERCTGTGPEAEETLDRLFAQGSRVVALATREMPATQTTIGDDDERELTLVGFLVFLDQPKKSAAQSLRDLDNLHITVKVATGDNVVVADKVVADLGMTSGGSITGAELDRLDDEEFTRAARERTVFARVTPEQKARIVSALQTHGQSVAFLGDGVNDALALHRADVGISVDSATDVAKDSADVVLLEKDLGVLARGVAEGRRTFANTIKYVQMSASSNFGNMFSAAGASAVLPFLPMMPSQILLNNLLYDSSQLAIPSDRVDAEALRSPSHWDIAAIRRFMVFFGPISSLFDFLTFAALIKIFHAQATEFHTAWFVESLATQILIVFAIRTRRIPFFRSRPSALLIAAVGIVLVIGVVLPFTPLARPLGFEALPVSFYVFLLVMVIGYLVVVELAKHVYYSTATFRPQLPPRWRGLQHRLERRSSRFTAVA